MRSGFLVVLVVCLGQAAAAPAFAQNVKAHKAAAERAIVKERWCEAVFLYTELDKVDANPEWALQAADAAQFADDRPRALSLYMSALERAKNQPRARAIEASIASLATLISKSGNGTACTPPPAQCGNGVVEQGESCDDGNVQSGDACPANCVGGSRGAPPPPPPPPLKTVEPPPVKTVEPPPPPPPPVKTVEPPSSTSGGTELCTLLKPVKLFAKGEWKSLDFGATVTIKSRGPQWTIVETQGGEGKIASSAMEGACNKDGASPAKIDTPPSKTEPPPPPPTKTEPPPPPPPETHVDTPPPHVEDRHEDRRDDRRREAEPLEPDHKPGNEAPTVKKGGGGLGGWITLGVGAALLVGGGVTATYGALPYFDYVKECQGTFGGTACPEVDKLAADYQKKTSDADRAKVATNERDLHARVQNAADAWDGTDKTTIPTGRFVFAGGAGVGGLGLALVVTGLIWGIAGGASAPDETAATPERSDDHEGRRR